MDMNQLDRAIAFLGDDAYSIHFKSVKSNAVKGMTPKMAIEESFAYLIRCAEAQGFKPTTQQPNNPNNPTN